MNIATRARNKKKKKRMTI